jgi:hypothetical protein
MPIYSEDGDKEDLGSRLAQAKKLARPHLNQQKAGHGGAHPSPNYVGSINKRTTVQAGQSRHKCETILEKYLRQKGLGVWLKR